MIRVWLVEHLKHLHLFETSMSVHGQSAIPRAIGHFIGQEAAEIDTVDELAVMAEYFGLQVATVPHASRQIVRSGS